MVPMHAQNERELPLNVVAADVKEAHSFKRNEDNARSEFGDEAISKQKRLGRISQAFVVKPEQSLLQRVSGQDLALRSRTHRIDGIAVGEVRRVNAVCGTAHTRGAARPAQIRTNIGLHWGGVGRLAGLQRPLLFGAVNLSQVVDTGILLGGRARFHEIGNRDRRQQPDDGHHDHDFHEREAQLQVFLDLHILSFCLTRGVNNAKGGFS